MRPILNRRQHLATVIAIIIFAIGLWWRTEYLFYTHPPTQYIYSDMQGYVSSAINFFNPAYTPSIGDTLYPPGMAYFLGSLYKLDHSWKLAIFAQWLLSAVIPILMAIIATLLFNRITALAVLMIGSLYFPFIDYAGYFLAENPFIFMMLISSICLLLALRSSHWTKMAWWGILAGFSTGVGAAFRSVILAPAMLTAIYLAIMAIKHRNRRIPVVIVSTLIGLLVVLIPLSLRCTRLNDNRFSIISTNGGLNFLQGHYGHAGHFKFHDKKRGHYYEFGNPTVLYKRYEEEVHLACGPYDANKLQDIAWEWIRSHPLDAALNSIEHVFDLYFGSVQWPTSHTDQRRWALLFQYLYLVALLLPALFRLQQNTGSMARLDKSAFSDSILWLPNVGIIATALLIIGEARYRIPFDAYTIILAAAFFVKATPRSEIFTDAHDHE